MQRNNPFFHRGPIHDSRFFCDRAEEIARAQLLLGRGQCVSIVGPRRIGKSSLLLRLATLLSGESGNRAVYFNCEGWSAAAPGTLYSLLVEAFRAGDALAPASLPLAMLDYRAFRDAAMRAPPPDGRLILLFDEFESLSANPNLDAGFFSGLRALATTGRVTFVTASARSLGRLTFAEQSALSSPFFNIFTQINLNPFSRADAAALIRDLSANAGTRLAETTVETVLRLAGPHPFFAQIAAFYAFGCADPDTGELTPSAAAQVREEFLMQMDAHWRYAWHELPPADRKQLACATGLTAAPSGMMRRLRELAMVFDHETGSTLLSPELAAFCARQPVDGLRQAPPFAIDETQHCAFLDGQLLELHGLEYDLLLLLATHPGEVLDHALLHAALWPRDSGDTENMERLKSVVKGLRRRLGAHEHLLQNVRGVGYVLFADAIDPE